MRFQLAMFSGLAFCAPLLAQLSAPKIGFVRYADGSLHSVQGLPSNMILADVPILPAGAASFSDSGGLVWRDGSIYLLGPDLTIKAQFPAGEKPVLSIDGPLTCALAWLPDSQILVHWDGTAFQSSQLSANEISGTVTDLQCAGPSEVRLLVEQSDGSAAAANISLRNGTAVSFEPLAGIHGPAYGQGSLLVYESEKKLVADDQRGSRRTVAMPAPDLTIERMSNNWLHLYSPSLKQHWALYVTQGKLDLSMLPSLPEPQTAQASIGNGGQK